MTEPKTCLVIGAGAGIGGTVGKKFAEEGYHAALCRRSDIDGLNGMVEGLQGSGLSASGHLLNAVDEGALESLMWFDWNTTKGTSKALGTTPTGRRSNFRSRTDANQPPSIFPAT